ncbi:hypothetical protein TD95_003300 [Thielaviopsis punctulata]|uniref:Chromo domain-containing protein n=1 Tax=Thielaviopsis punctulata TaxID=72032 RepID=A0A0F4ZBS3_9PEZI|nr:hypothetical protein TD95_003300 [Thielaviopsis punctulata]
MTTPMYIIGVDVGGTNTDAVILNPALSGADAVKAAHKATTGANVTTGIENAIANILANADVKPSEISALMIGTTHFINAVVERDEARLERVAAIRFPVINGYTAQINGGLQIEGDLIAPISESEVLAHADIIRSLGLKSVVITGVNSPQDEIHRQEETVAALFNQELGPAVNIICSKHVSGLGLLERENAAIINASILRFAQTTIRGFQAAMHRLDLKCPLYLTSNSGQLLTAKEAMQCPVQVFSSGPTNSLRGAAFLATKKQGIRYVVDIGGTTTDIGCLLPSGFPRLASAFTSIGGVKVNFSMPQVESIGLGGGSIVHLENSRVVVGPESVGKNLALEAQCFGGSVLTSTDIMVASGATNVGTLIPSVPDATMGQFKSTVKIMIEDHLDRMKTSPEPCDIILVGGGVSLCPPTLDGVASIEIPQHAAVANAIGAAVGEIGAGSVMVVDTSKKDERHAQVKEEAFKKALERGAKEGTVRVIEEEVSGLPYVEGKYKIVVKVSGLVDYDKLSRVPFEDIKSSEHEPMEPQPKNQKPAPLEKKSTQEKANYATYKPTILPSRLWSLSETDLLFISRGCYILGCGGGGSPYANYLETRQLLRAGETITIVDINDLPDDAKCPPVAGLGSPMVGLERPGSQAVLHAIKEMERFAGFTTTATFGAEIGGGNGMEALLWASSRYCNVPCVDADVMGRAYPRFECSSLFIGADDINVLLPAALASGDGTNFVLTHSKDSSSVDKTLRAACMTMGSAAGIACRPVSKAELQRSSIQKSISLAWRLGRAVSIAQTTGAVKTVPDRLIHEFGGPGSAGKMFEGKIVSVGQYLMKGHTYGRLVIERLAQHERDTQEQNEDETFFKVEIPFVNENLVLEGVTATGEHKVLASVPDLIMILDSITGEAVGVPEYRYGLKVTVMVANAHSLWASEDGLKIGGPAAFGYSKDMLEYKPAFSGGYGEVKTTLESSIPDTSNRSSGSAKSAPAFASALRRNAHIVIDIPKIPPPYTPRSGPVSRDATIIPVHDSTAYIVGRVFLPEGVAADGNLRPKSLAWLVGFRDRPTARIAVRAHQVLDYVSPRELEDYEYRQWLHKQEKQDAEPVRNEPLMKQQQQQQQEKPVSKPVTKKTREKKAQKKPGSRVLTEPRVPLAEASPGWASINGQSRNKQNTPKESTPQHTAKESTPEVDIKDPSQKHNENPDEPPDKTANDGDAINTEELGEDEYIVESIKDVKAKSGRLFFLVCWAGDWPPDQKHTWEPFENINETMTHDYLAAHPEKAAATRAATLIKRLYKREAQARRAQEKRESRLNKVMSAFEGDKELLENNMPVAAQREGDDDDDREVLMVTENGKGMDGVPFEFRWD